MECAGIPEMQLLPVAERSESFFGNGITVTVFPSLHALIPSDLVLICLTSLMLGRIQAGDYMYNLADPRIYMALVKFCRSLG